MANTKPTFKWVKENANYIHLDTRGCDTVAEWLTDYGETVTSTDLGSAQYPFHTFNAAMNAFEADGTIEGIFISGVFDNCSVSPTRECFLEGNSFKPVSKLILTSDVNFILQYVKSYYMVYDFTNIEPSGLNSPSCFMHHCKLLNVYDVSNYYTFPVSSWSNNIFVDCTFRRFQFSNISYTETTASKSIFIRCSGYICTGAGSSTHYMNDVLFVDCTNLQWSTLMYANANLNGVMIYNCFDDLGITPVTFGDTVGVNNVVLGANPLIGEDGLIYTGAVDVLTRGFNGTPITPYNSGVVFTPAVMATNATLVNMSLNGSSLVVDQWEKIATGGTTTTIVLASDASVVDDYYNGRKIEIISGSGVGSIRTITDYNGSTKTATLDTALDVSADTTSQYCISGYYQKNIDVGFLSTIRKLFIDNNNVRKIDVTLSNGATQSYTFTTLNGSPMSIYDGKGYYDMAINEQASETYIQNIRFAQITFEVETPHL